MAFSSIGPRGHSQLEAESVNELRNLMLLCLRCHRTIDSGDGATKFTVERLRAMKAVHEARVEAACGVHADRVSQVVTYATSVGLHYALPALCDASTALLTQRRYPSSAVVDLGTRDGANAEIDPGFWAHEANRLRKQFDRHVRQPAERGEISHLSVFALAPQPLLILLGTLIGDICPTDIYQRRREPSTWDWKLDANIPVAFQVNEPDSTARYAALVLSISAFVNHERIHRVLGPDVAVWTVTVPAPNNDVIRSPAALAEFRNVMRRLFDRIKQIQGHESTLHVFPAMPASLAIEFGRVRMPKADMRLMVYDEQQARGGFVQALTIEHGA